MLTLTLALTQALGWNSNLCTTAAAPYIVFLAVAKCSKMNSGLLRCIKSADESGTLRREKGSSRNVGTDGGTGGFTGESSLALSPLTPGHPESPQSRLVCACRSEEWEAGSVLTFNLQERWVGSKVLVTAEGRWREKGAVRPRITPPLAPFSPEVS